MCLPASEKVTTFTMFATLGLLGFDVEALGQLELLTFGQAGGRGVEAGNPAPSLKVRVRACE